MILSSSRFLLKREPKYKLLLCLFIAKIEMGRKDRRKELDVVKEKHENIILITRAIKTPSILKPPLLLKTAEERK